jgi:hypothetical protein
MPTSSVLPYSYLEKHRPPTTERISFTQGTFEATRIFEGPWEDRFNFVFNYLYEEITGVGNTTNYAIPHQYPDYTGAYVDDVDITGMGSSSERSSDGAPVWERAMIAAVYRDKPWNFDTLPNDSREAYTNAIFIEEGCDSDFEIFGLNGDDLKFTGEAVAAGDKISFNMTVINEFVSITTPLVSNPLWIAFQMAEGRINDEIFITPNGKVFNVGTLRYDGYSASTKLNIVETPDDFSLPIWELRHKFAYNPYGWNSKYNADDGEWTEIKTVSGDTLFKPIDFWPIFFGFTPGFAAADLVAIETAYDAIENRLKLMVSPTINDPFIIGQINTMYSVLRSMGFRV